MKDLDKMLAERGNPTPTRPLRADFTEDVINHISTHPRPTGLFARFKENVTMKLQKPATAFAAVGIALAIGGTTYAAFNWPTITSMFRGETKLSNGNRVVGVDTENCQYFGKPDPKASNKETMYYEIKKESKLANEQIVSMIKGICEENWHSDVVGKLIEPYAKKSLNIINSQASLVTALDADNITVVGDPKYDTKMRFVGKVTYSLTAKTKAYDGMNLTQLDKIKPGDTVLLIVDDKHPMPKGEPDVMPWDDPEYLEILAVVKVKPLTGSPDTFYQHLGIDFVRVEACKTDPSGFCRAYEFDK